MKENRPATFLDSPGFALADLGLAALAGVLWYNRPELGWLPLIPALLPWVLRLAFRRMPFKRTPVDLLFLVFVLTALVGVWAAYDRDRAWHKFWLILDGVLLFYALANQPRANFPLLGWAFGGFSAALSVYFFLTHDWTADPAKIEALNRLGLAWMDVRLTLPTHALHPNVVAGLTAMTAPFLVGIGLWEWRHGQKPFTFLAGLGFALVGFALLMTTSRGGWLALAGALGLWLLWSASRWVSRDEPGRRNAIFAVCLAVIALIGVIIVLVTPGGLIGLADRLPGPSHTGSRLDLLNALAWLIGDMPLTGGGLDAFPGLYAHYVKMTPFYILEHGHNLFLDVTLEQGLFGSLAFLLLVLVGVWKLFKEVRERWSDASGDDLILAAALAGLLVLVFHGLSDDTLYGSRAQLLLWSAPGLGFAFLNLEAPITFKQRERDVRRRVIAGVSVLVLLVYVAVFWNALRAVSLSNLGSVEMARIELADYPSGVWDDGSQVGILTGAALNFERVLEHDPDNRTAHHRLGLIALLNRDFPLAVAHLEVAHRVSPDHQGIVKALTYAYVWNGQQEQALGLVDQVPEAGSEMQVYTGWWQKQGRADLAQRAAAMVSVLISR